MIKFISYALLLFTFVILIGSTSVFSSSADICITTLSSKFQRAIQLMNEGMTISEVAERVGITDEEAFKRELMRMSKDEPGPRVTTSPDLLREASEQAIRLMEKKGLSIRDTAIRVGIKETTFRRELTRMNKDEPGPRVTTSPDLLREVLAQAVQLRGEKGLSIPDAAKMVGIRMKPLKEYIGLSLRKEAKFQRAVQFLTEDKGMTISEASKRSGINPEFDS